MNRPLRLLDTLLTCLGCLFLGMLVVVAFLQVVCRYVGNNALPWPEEICRFTFIGMAYVGMATTMRNNSHLRVDLALGLGGPAVRHALNLLALAASVLYCWVSAWLTWDMLLEVKDMGQMAASVDIPVYLTWLPIPTGFLLTGVYAVHRLGGMVFGRVRA